LNFVARAFVLLREDAANEGQVEGNLHGGILIPIPQLGERMRTVQKRWAHACNARATKDLGTRVRGTSSVNQLRTS
jgi:hypothetical protein